MLKRFSVLVLLLALLAGIWQAENIYEWWFLRNYQPPAEIVAIADRAALNDVGRREFYLGDPSLDDKTSFSTHCPVTELSLVLGCYSHGKIYVLRVDRAELAAVTDVTAAHEMLHAAYSELSRDEREQVNRWIEAFYKTVDDPKIQELVAEYEKTEPGERLNELHSILPTQVAILSPELESYFKRYFTNRQQVVVAYKGYEAVFDSVEDQIAALKSEIESLRARLDSLEAQIDQRRVELEATNDRLDQLRAQNRFDEYNALVPTQNAQVQAYNSLVNQYKQTVSLHNAKVDQINRLALKQNQLVDTLDSTKFNPVSTQ